MSYFKARFFSIKIPKLIGAINNFENPILPRPTSPVLFLKNYDSINEITKEHKTVSLDLKRGSYFEIEPELGIKISKFGEQISLENAQDFIGDCFIAVDVTRRFYDKTPVALDSVFKFKLGSNLTPIGPKISMKKFGKYIFDKEMELHLSILNRNTTGFTKMDKIYFNPKELIVEVGKFSHVQKNDVIMCGTGCALKLENNDDIEVKMIWRDKLISAIRFDIRFTQVE